ncbi:MAG: MotA/TolQ/ExbB proton channel family protein, partial [Paracoccaceae bacterium]
MLSGLFASLGTGGPIIAILLALSLLSVGLIIAKSVQLLPARSGAKLRDAAFAKWSGGDRDTARTMLAGGRSPADRVTAFAMDGILRGLPRTPLEAEVERQGNAEVEAMSRHIRLLELVAMIAPLLGLLGTVLGMIQSFQELEMAQGAANASVLAGGIWQALLTTAAGLVVAIPAAIASTLLTARIDSATLMIEAAVGRFFL